MRQVWGEKDFRAEKGDRSEMGRLSSANKHVLVNPGARGSEGEGKERQGAGPFCHCIHSPCSYPARVLCQTHRNKTSEIQASLEFSNLFA